LCDAVLCDVECDLVLCDVECELDADIAGAHVPVPTTQLLNTCDAGVHVELHTAVKLPPEGMYPGRHCSVQMSPCSVYVDEQFVVFVWPVGNVGNPMHAEEYMYAITSSSWTYPPNWLIPVQSVATLSRTCRLVACTGTVKVVAAVVHNILPGIGPASGPRKRLVLPDTTTAPLLEKYTVLTCTTELFADDPAANM